MSKIEDLIKELKNEDLLAATSSSEVATVVDEEVSSETTSAQSDEVETLVVDESDISIVEPESNNTQVLTSADIELSIKAQTDLEAAAAEEESLNSKPSDDNVDETEEAHEDNEEELEDKDAYLQRVVDSVKSLQYVEHVISGVQREQMREKPNTYETETVKQKLHDFFAAVDEMETPDTTPAESELMKEMELWHTALLERDKNMSAAHLRRYFETTEPPLGSEAIVSMARFYRNSPFNEEVRSKFDLVTTRLFSKDIGDDKRQVVFERDELIQHLKELYADWSSVSLYKDDEENSDVVLAAFKFDDYVTEAKKVKSFDELITKGFFKRVKSFKKKTEENFFAPLIVAFAVESNIAIGNRYVDLINAERSNQKSKSLEERYGALHDNNISEAMSKSVQLVDLLNKKEADDNSVVAPKGIKTKIIVALVAVGLVAAILVGLTFAGVFSSNNSTNSDNEAETLDISKQGVAVNFEQSSLSTYIKEARVRENILFAIVTPSWSELSYKEKEEVLTKIQLAGDDRGYKKVQLSRQDQTSAGIASESGINIIE